jgi:hypothetical protein
MQVGYGISNAAMFQNLQNTQYWYGTEGGSGAWYLSPYYGIQGSEVKSYPGYAMAVHSGDVGTVVANVPEPETTPCCWQDWDLSAQSDAAVAVHETPTGTPLTTSSFSPPA